MARAIGATDLSKNPLSLAATSAQARSAFMSAKANPTQSVSQLGTAVATGFTQIQTAIDSLANRLRALSEPPTNTTARPASLHLHADHITAGTIDARVVRVTHIDADEITSGSIDASLISVTNINADHITTGTLSAGRLAAGSIDATKLTIRQVMVAGLTLTNNSPSGGNVAWSSCTVYYDGTAYPVSSGNTTGGNGYVSWSIGASTFTQASTFSPSATVFLIATNSSGVGDPGWNKLAGISITTAAVANSAITTAKVNDLAVTTAKLDNLAVTNAKVNDLSASKINAGTLDASVVNVTNLNASNISTGTLAAARIAAATIDASKLNIRSVVVAGMTLTNNSPGAGSVAWSACTVYHDGTAYSVTGSNSSSKYLTWSPSVSSGTVFTGAATYAPAAGTFLIATNLGGTADTAWDKVASGGVTQQAMNLPWVLLGPNGSLMVDVAFTSNDPTSTSVSWAAGKVTYKGITYSTSSGSSGGSNFWVYWQLSSPTSIQSSSTYPSLGDDDFLLGINGSSTSGGTLGYWDPCIEIHNNEGQRLFIVAGSVFAYSIDGDLMWAMTRSAADPPGAGIGRWYSGSSSTPSVTITGSNGKVLSSVMQAGEWRYDGTTFGAPGGGSAGYIKIYDAAGNDKYIQIWNP